MLTHFPHSFLMLLLFFRCSGEPTNRWPDSAPEDWGEESEGGTLPVFSVFPSQSGETEKEREREYRSDQWLDTLSCDCGVKWSCVSQGLSFWGFGVVVASNSNPWNELLADGVIFK